MERGWRDLVIMGQSEKEEIKLDTFGRQLEMSDFLGSGSLPRNGWPKEAADVTRDPNGRWYPFSLTMETIFVLEKKQLPSHLVSLPCVDTPTQLRDMILQLEDAGEARFWSPNMARQPKDLLLVKNCGANQMGCPCKVKLGASHHSLVDGAITSEKQLVFVLDHREADDGEEKKKRKRGEKKKDGPSFKNFGAYVQPTKIKGSQKLLVGWRARRIFFLRNELLHIDIVDTSISSYSNHFIIVCISSWSFIPFHSCFIGQAWDQVRWHQVVDAHPAHCLCLWHHGCGKRSDPHGVSRRSCSQARCRAADFGFDCGGVGLKQNTQSKSIQFFFHFCTAPPDRGWLC